MLIHGELAQVCLNDVDWSALNNYSSFRWYSPYFSHTLVLNSTCSVFVKLDIRRCKRYCCFSTGTIAPLVKAPNVSDHKSGGGEGLKMMVTISCVLVGIVVIFTGLLMLRRRRREQRLKRLRGERRGVAWLISFYVSASHTCFPLFILQMPKVWLRC